MSEWFTFSIWKFEMPLDGATLEKGADIEMPVAAQIRAVGCQGTRICLWAQVKPDSAKDRRRFVIVPTGGEFTQEDEREYVGTAFMHSGAFVWHIFEVPSK